MGYLWMCSGPRHLARCSPACKYIIIICAHLAPCVHRLVGMPCSEASVAFMACSIKFAHNSSALQILHCKRQTLLRPGNEASMVWVSDPPTSISFFSCSRVLNLFCTSLIRLNTCTRPDPAPVPCFVPARNDLWIEKGGKSTEMEETRGESKVHLNC